jgi:hypothetical protein
VPAPLELDPVGGAPELDPPLELLLELDDELEPEPAPGVPGAAPLELELLAPPELELLEAVPLVPDELPPLEDPPRDAPELLLPEPTEVGAPASRVAPASVPVLPTFVGGSNPFGSVDAVSAEHAASKATDRTTPVKTDAFFMDPKRASRRPPS